MDIHRIKVVPKWTKTREEIWNDKFQPMLDSSDRSGFTFLKVLPYAAVFLILLCSGIFLFVHKETVISPFGQHVAVVLPDGSNVTLNADSQMEYKPYWWYISRNVRLEGEAYFEVLKGKRFKVSTPNGNISVLGTEFNVYSRKNKFEVACVSGRVEVSARKQKATLSENKVCSLNQQQQLVLKEEKQLQNQILWKEGKFFFSNTPLMEVLDEVERQYGIKIQRPADLDYYYTGSFSMDRKVEDVLQIIGTPFAVKFKYY